MKYKHISVISYHTCPLSDEKGTEIGGLNIYVLELSKELIKKGYIIDIFTRAVDPSAQKVVAVSPNLRIIHLPAGEKKMLSKKLVKQYIPEFVENIYTFMKEENLQYTIVSSHYYLSGLIGLHMKKKLQIPLLMTFHTLALMKNLVARSDDEREDLERIEAETMLSQQADTVIATSAKDAEYIQTLYGCPAEKILVLIPGVNLDLFKPIDKSLAKEKINFNPKQKLILFAGRIEPLKGIDMLLYAMKILIGKNPLLDISLWIVGGDTSKSLDKWSNELKRLEEIRNVLGITTAVTFVGMKQPEELPYYYNAAEIMVLPSQYESFGITALEAMACGTPVIATDVTGISGIIDQKHGSLVTSASNPILLAKKIENLLLHEESYKKLSKIVFDKVQDLSWSNVAEKFGKFLQDF